MAFESQKTAIWQPDHSAQLQIDIRFLSFIKCIFLVLFFVEAYGACFYTPGNVSPMLIYHKVIRQEYQSYHCDRKWGDETDSETESERGWSL